MAGGSDHRCAARCISRHLSRSAHCRTPWLYLQVAEPNENGFSKRLLGVTVSPHDRGDSLVENVCNAFVSLESETSGHLNERLGSREGPCVAGCDFA